MQILVVVLSFEIGEVMARILECRYARPVVSGSLKEATHVLQASHFDLVITDALNQDHASSFNPAFLQELRSAGGGTPIILCSTYVSAENIRAGQFGLAAVVPQPFEVDELLAKVESVVERKHRVIRLNSGQDAP